jgi:hypothetical protein
MGCASGLNRREKCFNLEKLSKKGLEKGDLGGC